MVSLRSRNAEARHQPQTNPLLVCPPFPCPGPVHLLTSPCRTPPPPCKNVLHVQHGKSEHVHNLPLPIHPPRLCPRPKVPGVLLTVVVNNITKQPAAQQTNEQDEEGFATVTSRKRKRKTRGAPHIQTITRCRTSICITLIQMKI